MRDDWGTVTSILALMLLGAVLGMLILAPTHTLRDGCSIAAKRSS